MAIDNPTKYCKHTRTYEQMRMEHDLNHLGELDEMDILKLRLALGNNIITSSYLFPIITLAISIFCLILTLKYT